MNAQILKLGLCLLAFSVLNSCRKDDADINDKSGARADVATQWYDLSLKLTKEGPGFTPPVAARTFAYIGIALYEAISQQSDRAATLQGQLPEFSKGTVPVIVPGATYNWDIVANAVLSQSFQLYYKNASAANKDLISNLDVNTHNQYAIGQSVDVVSRSRDFGIAVAQAVHKYATSDGQSEAYNTNFPDSYIPPVGPGLWVPTPPAFQRALQPYWGNVRPFMSANITPIQPPGAPAYSETPGTTFYNEALEVFQVAGSLTNEQKTIANFWSDDPGITATPPGHSISILTQIIKIEKPTLLRAAEMYARVGMAVHDAFVSCWKTKYITNVLRPITYIRMLFDPNYNTFLNTPPFPEYTSGHSVQCGATSKILEFYFGSSYAFSDQTHIHRSDINGTPRQFSSFKAMASEAAISRLYGGIHYKSAIDHGIAQGEKIGNNITTLTMAQ